jgi:type I restriction enzyme, R subunit
MVVYKQIQLVQKEIGASEFITIIEPVDIFDLDRSNAEIESIVGTAAQADAIATRIKKVAIERMEEDPVLYLRLSQLIQTAIDAHRAKRLYAPAKLWRSKFIQITVLSSRLQ